MSRSNNYGAEAISQERWDQIHKHGWDETDHYYINGELLQAAKFCLNPSISSWPEGWGAYYRDKIFAKTEQQRLAVAGAFIAAEIDRLRKLEHANPLRSGKDENTKGI